MIKNLHSFVEDEILNVLNIPMCLTQEVATQFVLDVIDISATDESWLGMSNATRLNKVQNGLDRLETAGRLSSRMVAVKKRYFDDDIEKPKLFKRVRVYIRKR